MSWRPACPQCRHPIPFGSTLRRGRTFRCRRCGAPLLLTKPGLRAVLAAVAVLGLVTRGLWGVRHGLLLVVLLFAILIFADYLLAKPKIAKDREP
jgi:hypothetical protein